MFDFSWQKTVHLKDGSTVELRYPSVEDAEKLQIFINEIVDEDTYILLNQEQSLNEERAHLSAMISMMHQGLALKICAYTNDRIVAATDITKHHYKQNHIGRYSISISQDYRGKGLGRVLMTEALEQAKEHLDIKMMKLSCYADNVPGQKLYQSLGFTEYGRLPNAIQYKGKLVDQLNYYKMLE